MFQERCDATSDGEGYVDCVDGFVKDTTTTCATACGNTDQGGVNTDGTISSGFTGKGKQREVLVGVFMLFMNLFGRIISLTQTIPLLLLSR